MRFREEQDGPILTPDQYPRWVLESDREMLGGLKNYYIDDVLVDEATYRREFEAWTKSQRGAND